MLEVRHLRIVQAIADTGSVTRASRRLHLTQPAVSHALADLETKLGVRLFRRNPGGMVITDAGARLVEAAAIVLDEVARAESDLRVRRAGRVGAVRLSTECYTCYHWLPGIIQQLGERLPQVEVEIVPDATLDPVQALLDGRLDMAIVHTAVAHPDVVYEPLFTDELVVAVAPAHPWAERESVRAEDFADQTVLFHSDPGGSTLVTDVLEPAGVFLSNVLVLQLTEAVLASVKAGLGVTVMASWALRPELEAGGVVLVRMGAKGLHRSWQLATLKDRSRRESIQELAGALKNVLAGESARTTWTREPAAREA